MKRVLLDEESPSAGDDARRPLNNSSSLNEWINDESISTEKRAHSKVPTSEEDIGGPEIDTNIPRMMFYTRVINFALSICMIAASLLQLLTTNSPTTGVLACYVIVFACLLCCFETHLKQVSKFIAANFGFLYSAKSRAFFMVFVGTLLFSFSLFGMLIGLLMLVNAGLNIFIICRYPNYDEIQRKDAQAEITDFLKTNPAFAQQVMAVGVKATTDFVAKNPDLTRQGVEQAYAATSPRGSSVSTPAANSSRK